MDTAQFWRMIDDSLPAGDLEAQTDRLAAALARLPRDELLEFDAHFTEASRRLYSWEMLNAATAILGYVSDDVFADFRYWVISRGRRTFDAVLESPDAALAAIEIGDAEEIGDGELFGMASLNAYEELGGRPIYEDFPDRSFADAPADELTGPKLPDHARALAERFPLLTAKHRGRSYHIPAWPLRLARLIGSRRRSADS